MIPGNLSLQQAPPLSVPARFFVTAPVFGAAASLILLFSGTDLLLSRWTPGMLAMTHCLVLGFFASIMIGAVQQMLPVLAGVTIPRPGMVAALIYVQWLPAVVLLVIALMQPVPVLFALALLLMTGAILSFLIPVVVSLRRAESKNESVPGIKLALFSLFITLVLGVILALGYTGVVPLWRPVLTNLHLTWGLIGWIGMLIMAIAWQVVPMFQITPAYPAWLRRATVSTTLSLLLLKTIMAALGYSEPVARTGIIIDLIIAGGLLCFAVTTLQIQRRARRRIRDSHRDFWRLAMINLLAVAILWIIAELTADPVYDLLAAAVFLLGFAMAVVTGMLLKILSFLIWLHLQTANDGLRMAGKQGFTVPRMKSIISSRSSDWLLFLLIAAELVLIAALVFPHLLTTLAALMWLTQFSLLTVVIARALHQYQQIIKDIPASSA